MCIFDDTAMSRRRSKSPELRCSSHARKVIPTPPHAAAPRRAARQSAPRVPRCRRLNPSSASCTSLATPHLARSPHAPLPSNSVSSMSGGVGPTAGGGIALPSMGQPPPPLHPMPTSPTARPHHHYYLFSIKQLNTLGAAAVLAFSTTVPLSEIAFAVLLLPYLLLLATLAFPQRPGKPNPAAPVFVGPGRVLLAAHSVAGFLVGGALPALYILDGLRTADTAGVAAASPHAFLLASQVFTEGLTAAWPWRFSLPVRAAVPVMYSVRRMFAAGEWLRQEMEETRGGPAGAVPPRRVLAGRVLAVANLTFWGANLFAFLVPFYLPRALQRYYCGGGDGARGRDGDEDKKDS